MKRSAKWLLLIFTLLVLSCATVARADYGAGQAAWKAGRYAEAMKEWRRAARAGDRRAMAALGRAFVRGVGVPQDFIEAHKWLNLAAARGDEKAAAERDALAKEMTVEERAEARKLLRAWRTAGSRRSTAIVPRRRTPSTPRPPRRMARKGSPGNAALRAVAAGNISALDKALAAGADANARGGKRGWTPLMYAADKGYTLLVPPLLKAGAKPNLRAADGATALFIAALRGQTEIIELLMKWGADPSIRGAKGRTAVEVARMRYGAVEAAKKKGATPPLLALLEGKTWAQAKAQEDDKAFAKARSAGTVAAYTKYLSSRPQGRHAEEALRLKAQIEEQYRRLRAQNEEQDRHSRAQNEERDRRLRAQNEEWDRRLRARSEELRKRGWKVFRDCLECPEIVVVSAGSFMMGSPSSEEGWSSDESPRHLVTIAKPFAVGKYEVTFAEWDACVADGGCGGYWPGDEGWGRGRRPVINVSWDDAKEYVRWLSRKTGMPYRLLSETEWEYSARAGTTTRYSWGDEVGHNWANCIGCGGSWGSKQTALVGSFLPNRFGLHDVHGNVWEWVEDCWNGSYASAPSDGSAWTDEDCKYRVLRGGSYDSLTSNIRSASRISGGRYDRSKYNGFRVTRTLAP